ncbi:hypothetical protein FF100_34785 [Methylobacterium terricola]|uniref:Uncharacterized protein n=1 Tax=Methylobacterium terricola TaxID=2583531 RepID=A0A5C4L5P6_9HYPH|nr:hypothetical protein [Methylobacterium terricola]TNC06265.1 hypothetical protein FF100_34785 [Methylobacterium terricola]
MTLHARGLALTTGMLALMAPAAQASIITDFLDRIGGCRKPLSQSFSYEVSPYTPKPYGKALADWTDQDVADFRAYFLVCQTRRPDWQSMGEDNRRDAIRVIDTTLAELRYKVGDARATAAKQRADAAYEAERRRRDDEQRAAEAEATAQRAQAEQAANAEQGHRNDVRQKARQVLTDLLAFTQNELEMLPPRQKLERLDGFIARMQEVGREAGDAPVAKPLLTMLDQTIALRSQIARAQARDMPAARSQAEIGTRSGRDDGAYTDYEWLGQRGIMAMTNPLQREEYRASLARGIDFNVGVSAIEPSASGWLVQLSGRLGAAGTPGQGFFCRVSNGDAASLAVLREIAPPYGIVHVAAPDADEFLMESRPLRIRVVFSPCRITSPSNGTNRRSTAERSELSSAPPAGQANRDETRVETREPVAPSPAGLLCTSRPPRNDAQRAMAHRLRRVWAIPEALRADPSLLLTFSVTLNFDAELTAPPQLVRSQSQAATPGQMQAAVEAARQAIQQQAPYTELGSYAGGMMQVDLTPCD